MKLNKKIVKQGLQNQLITTLHMIAFNIISFIVFCASNIGTKPTGNSTAISGLFNVKEYKANLFFVIFFWIVFLLLFSVFYTKFFKKDLKKQMKIHWIFRILFFVESVAFGYVEFLIIIITILMSRDSFFATTSNYPDNIGIIALIYIIGYILIDFILDIRVRDKENTN